MKQLPLDRSPKNETVIIVHGIWMNGLLMQMLARHLRGYGYKTKCVSYPFLSRPPAENAARLAAVLEEVDTDVVHWAAHSLGGVVWLHLVNSGYELPPGRTVLLGSPVRGSEAASRIYKQRWLRPLLGRSVESGLLGGAPLSFGSRTVGLIRGGGVFSLARWVIGSHERSDGVVSHAETAIDDVACVTEVPRSHSMMVFSSITAKKAAEFFAHGEFSNTG